MAKQDKVQKKMEELSKMELTLFHSYNRHANSDKKLEVLNKLIVVINQLEILKQVG